MVNVKVRYFTTLRELAGVSEETIRLRDGAVLADLIEKIASKYGEAAREYLYSKGKVDTSIYFLINGEDSRALSGLRTRLREGDIVAIIPPIGGG
jgi:molybdopterin synthase sulfur carrier subunit